MSPLRSLDEAGVLRFPPPSPLPLRGWAAAPDEILVSRTICDLVVGSGLAFEDRGSHELKAHRPVRGSAEPPWSGPAMVGAGTLVTNLLQSFSIRHTRVATFCLRSCAIMETMHWSDARLDDLNARVTDLGRRMDEGFGRVDADLRALNGRFDALQRTMLQVGGGLIAALMGVIAALVGTQL